MPRFGTVFPTCAAATALALAVFTGTQTRLCLAQTLPPPPPPPPPPSCKALLSPCNWNLPVDECCAPNHCGLTKQVYSCQKPTIVGTDGNDTLVGKTGEGTERFFGLGGDDRIIGNGDFNVELGGDGNDWLRGGSFFDFLQGDDGNDNINGEDLADEISGGAGDDVIRGGAGIDLLNGGAGNDVIVGGMYGISQNYITGQGYVDINVGDHINLRSGQDVVHLYKRGAAPDRITYYIDTELFGINNGVGPDKITNFGSEDFFNVCSEGGAVTNAALFTTGTGTGGKYFLSYNGKLLVEFLGFDLNTLLASEKFQLSC